VFILKGATNAHLIEGPKNVGNIIEMTWPNMTSHTWKIFLKSQLHVNTIFFKNVMTQKMLQYIIT
jgi:hypothetical protein